MDQVDRFTRDFTDSGQWYVEDTKSKRKIRIGNRQEGAFVIAEIYHDSDPDAAFDRILLELGEVKS